MAILKFPIKSVNENGYWLELESTFKIVEICSNHNDYKIIFHYHLLLIP